jgi:hypothetical protein
MGAHRGAHSRAATGTRANDVTVPIRDLKLSSLGSPLNARPQGDQEYSLGRAREQRQFSAPAMSVRGKRRLDHGCST